MQIILFAFLAVMAYLPFFMRNKQDDDYLTLLCLWGGFSSAILAVVVLFDPVTIPTTINESITIINGTSGQALTNSTRSETNEVILLELNQTWQYQLWSMYHLILATVHFLRFYMFLPDKFLAKFKR